MGNKATAGAVAAAGPNAPRLPYPSCLGRGRRGPLEIESGGEGGGGISGAGSGSGGRGSGGKGVTAGLFSSRGLSWRERGGPYAGGGRGASRESGGGDDAFQHGCAARLTVEAQVRQEYETRNREI